MSRSMQFPNTIASREKSASKITARIPIWYIVYSYECAIYKDTLPKDKNPERYNLKGS